MPKVRGPFEVKLTPQPADEREAAAFLGRLNPIGILVAALVVALTFIGGESAQILLKLPLDLTQAFQGILLLCVLAADALVRAIRGADKQSITAVRLFDRFEGGEGLSLAVEVALQPSEKSFTDDQIAGISQRTVGGRVRRRRRASRP